MVRCAKVGISIAATGCMTVLWTAPAYAQCTKDTECKGDRVCVHGECVEPPTASTRQPEHPMLGEDSAHPVLRLNERELWEVACLEESFT